MFDGAVDKEWDRLVSTTTSFEKCTREWYVANSVKLTPLAAIDICSEERVAAKTATDDLARTARAIQRKAIEDAASSEAGVATRDKAQ